MRFFESSTNPQRSLSGQGARYWTCLMLFAGLGLSSKVLAIDLMPEDAIAPPVGLQSLQLRAIASKYQGAYLDGRRLNPDSQLTAEGAALRYARVTEFFGRPTVIYADQSYGELKTRLDGAKDAGPTLGDLSVAVAHWLLNDAVQHRYAGVVGYLVAPTGDYDPRFTSGYVNTNLGQNRWTFALQTGYSARVFTDLTWLVAADVIWFGKNDEFSPNGRLVTLEQRPLKTIQNHLSQRVTPPWMIGLGHIWTTGGRWLVDGLDLGNEENTHRLQLSSTYDFPGAFRLGLQAGRALKTKNGLAEKREVTVRLWHFF